MQRFVHLGQKHSTESRLRLLVPGHASGDEPTAKAPAQARFPKINTSQCLRSPLLPGHRLGAAIATNQVLHLGPATTATSARRLDACARLVAGCSASSATMASGAPPETRLDLVLLALGHPTRRAMLERLREGPAWQAKLARLSPTALATGVKHVGFLERAALARVTKNLGRTSIRLDTKPLDELRDWMSKLYPEDARADTVTPMSTADDRIRASIDTFIADLSELVRESALDAVRHALQQGGPTKPNGAARASGGVRGIAGARKPGAKRTPEELDQMTAALLDYVTKNPGQRIEEIAAGMGMTTNDLRLPAKKLIGGTKIKTKGQKRATRYFPR